MTAAVAAIPLPAAATPPSGSRHLAATAASPIKGETTDFLRMVERMIRRAGQRVAVADMEQLEQLLDLRDVLDDAIADAITGVRASGGYSWQAIGDAAGVRRQSAHERWSRAPVRSAT